ncbi:MAG TPA: MFS transporter [Caulobacter sp.]|nr:MFS transporter [Caulobacter sp.]
MTVETDPGRRAVAIVAVLGAMAAVVLDAGLVNAALPTMARSLGTTAADAVRVVTAYQAALLMALLPSGALGERYGHRAVFTAGVAVFTTASLLCALAPSLPWLVAARFLQGLGGAAVMALGVALLRFTVATDRLGAAIGWNATTVALCSAAGPALGAVVLSRAGWPWLFAINLPLGLGVCLAAGALPSTARRDQAIDPVSMLLNASSFAALIGGVGLFPVAPALGVPLIAAAGLAFALLIRRERSKVAPMVPVDLLRRPGFRLTVIAALCGFAGQTAALVALPFHLHQLGLTVWEAGTCLSIWPMAVAATAMTLGRGSDWLPLAWLSVVGGLLLAIGLASAALASGEASVALLIPCLALSGVGFGLFQTANNRSLFLAAPPERSGAVGGLQGTARLIGQTAGAVMAAGLLEATSLDIAPGVAFGVGALLTLAAAVVSGLRAWSREAAA